MQKRSYMDQLLSEDAELVVTQFLCLFPFVEQSDHFDDRGATAYYYRDVAMWERQKATWCQEQACLLVED